MDEEILNKLKELDEKIGNVYVSAEKTRKYFMWTMIATLIFFIVPLLAIAIILPSLINNISNLYGM
jgi:ABC-type arginine transport system permease subunit